MFDFPNSPTLNQSVTAPLGALFVWDGLKWITGANATPTPPSELYLPLGGGTTTGPICIGIGTGTGTGAPTLTLNGAASGGQGVQWQTAGTTRWQAIVNPHDTSGDLEFYSFDANGTYLGTVAAFMNDMSQIFLGAPIYYKVQGNIAAQAVVGVTAEVTNTGTNSGNGAKYTYFSSADSTGFDCGSVYYSIFNPTWLAAQPQYPQLMGSYASTVSPNDGAHNWSCLVAEFNIVNRGPDMGWSRDRAGARWTGGFLMVSEVSFPAQSGQGVNSQFAYSLSPSGGNNSTGYPAKFYNGFRVEPNAIVGQTGRAFYATGDTSGVASQYPYGPIGIEGTWLHGIDHTLATYTDGHAQTMLVGQGIAWIVGTTGAATATASIAASGSGANASLTLTPAGTGTINYGVLPLSAANDAAAATAGVPIGGTYRNGSVLQVRVT